MSKRRTRTRRTKRPTAERRALFIGFENVQFVPQPKVIFHSLNQVEAWVKRAATPGSRDWDNVRYVREGQRGPH